MKLSLSLILFFTLLINLYTHAQQIHIDVKNAEMKGVFRTLRRQSGYAFMYNLHDLKKARPVTLKYDGKDINAVLQLVFRGQPLAFTINDKLVNITPRQSRKSVGLARDVLILPRVEGLITDEDGSPIAGATVALQNGNQDHPQAKTKTDDQGKFVLIDVRAGAELEVSIIGYLKLTLSAAPELGSIRLKPNTTSLKEVAVVSTGMTVRAKETFTGAAAVYTGEQLKRAGNVNIIKSLRSLDPSLIILENNRSGSNPNALPGMELRGQSSITTASLRDDFTEDPNQPLFILDGFETTLRTIVDLDMNRVATITLLKDAASTAIYGSRASNGVVVVETIQPKPGEIRLNYTSDFTMERPDLSAYSMMNASEKLQFEKLSGVYTAPALYPELQNLYYDPLYSQKLRKVISGVNSYWLNDPLQTGISQRQSLYAEGGSSSLTFNVGGNYRTLQGTMIGSGRKDWGARLNLSYRTKKLKVNNNAYLSGYRADESNYGSFSTWVNMNPYYEKVDNTEPYVFSFYDSRSNDFYYPAPSSFIHVSNPHYNAALNSFNKSTNLAITNNLQLIYDWSKKFRLQASVQFSNSSTTSNVFKSPLNTDFDNVDVLKKGSYNYRHTESLFYTANAMASYAEKNGKHAFQANLRTEIQDKSNELKGFIAEGFPNSTNGNPRFAYNYEESGIPLAVKSIARRNSLIANGYYSYDERYNVDVSFTYDGSTSFGLANSYQPFAAIGASWNLHKEHFAQSADWLDVMRLRLSYGVTGNQNFASASSISTFRYLPDYNYFGQGVSLEKLGNPNLKWQNTYQANLGLDAELLHHRLTLQLNGYRKYTRPLVLAIDLPSSTSLSNYPINAGNLNTLGLEGTVRFAPVYQPERRIIWFVNLTGTTMKQRYSGFNDMLSGLNQSLQSLNSLTRYHDGYDYYDIWAVPSLGIDPASGREIFQKRDGSKTFSYSYDDIVKVGNSRPDLQGVFSNTFSYKGLNFSVYLRYFLNRDVWNEVLFNKVENISLTRVINTNLDKRALYDRWQQPGDQAQFKAISLTGTTPMSSRFIQREDAISIEAVSMGYEFAKNRWMAKARISSLRLNAYTNDLYYFSTVRAERGLDYPFARSFSLSLSATLQ